MAKPQPSVMYMVGPRKNANLIAAYNTIRKDPSKDTILIPIDKRLFDTTSAAVVYSDNASRDRQLRTSGVPTESFIELVKLPNTVRPDTFQECVDFFYPNSGVRSRPTNKSPFISTALNAYSFPNNPLEWDNPSKNSMPLALGEVSMMYGWFIFYRLLLCPKRFSNVPLVAPEKLFMSTGDATVLSEAQTTSISPNVINVIKTLSQMRDIVSLAAQVSKYSGPSAMPAELSRDVAATLTTIKTNRELLKLIAQGSNGVVKLVSKNLGWNKDMSTLFVSFVLDGIIPASKYNALPAAAKDIFKEIAMYELIHRQKLTPGDAYILCKETDFALTAHFLKNTTRDKLSEAAKKYVSDRRKSFAQKKAVEYLAYAFSQENRSLAGKRLKGQANDSLLSAVALSQTEQALNTFMTQSAVDAKLAAGKAQKYYYSVSYDIHPAFSELGYSFSFDSYQNQGALRFHNFLVGSDMSRTFADAPKSMEGRIRRYSSEIEDWVVYPTGAVQNGGELLSFWTEVYRILKPAIQIMRGLLPGGRKDVLTALSMARSQVKTPGNRFPNPGLREFLIHLISSTIAVFKNLDAFSPFTHTFGFAPTVLFNSTNLPGKQELDLLKGKLYTVKTPDMVVIGEACQKYMAPKASLYTRNLSGDLPQGFAPAQKNYYSYMKTPKLTYQSLDSTNMYLSDWKMSDLQSSRPFEQKIKPNVTVNSQRKLQDAFGGALSIGFDTALDIPIFNAQWSAALSVVLCYPEALDTLAQANIAWAKTLKSQIVSAKNKAARDAAMAEAKAAISAMDLSAKPKVSAQEAAMAEARAAIAAMNLPGAPAKTASKPASLTTSTISLIPTAAKTTVSTSVPKTTSLLPTATKTTPALDVSQPSIVAMEADDPTKELFRTVESKIATEPDDELAISIDPSDLQSVSPEFAVESASDFAPAPPEPKPEPEPEPEPEPAATPTEEKKSNTGLYIAAGVGVAALAGLGFWMKNKKK